ncbi:MAG: hypothetical protein JW929_07790 [Anaerolineales bacterium]|nr:hypothetical protein [Anaerolineales bacterium]
MKLGLGSGFAPQRVVSLLPAITDSMVVLGLGRFLVGVTDECPLPDELGGIVRVGRLDSPKIETIAGLHPDLVALNAEETPPGVREAVAGAGICIWETAPQTVPQAVSDLRDLVLCFASETALQSVVWLERTVDWLGGSRPERRKRVFCPRSREGPAEDPSGWVTFNGDTYPGDLLSLCGADNVFSGRQDCRYPLVTPQEVAAADPEMILLPNSPFPFGEEDASFFRRKMPGLQAVRAGQIRPLDGRLVFWTGVCLGKSIRLLPDWFRT